MPRRFHAPDEQLPPASLVKRLLAMLYDGLICIAVLLVATWGYTLLAAWAVGFDHYMELAEAGALNTDPLLSSFLFVILYLFFAYFWTRNGQTLGMQVWRIRVENSNGTSISWIQALLRYMMGWASWLTAGLGYFWMLWDGNKATWTDRFSESRVVSIANKKTD
ncbi:RDD family protein [Marinobacter caseinilyticus]|uniref:RDD family protein n=1 Tax=Marinobacter caseinilyticus TaxID=2692195 RepID=UPI001409CD96|nr:RDD family protein [Marinobacter caseinilyticus]